MHRKLLFLSAACAALIATKAPADVVELTDGRVLVGTVRRAAGMVEVATKDGTHTVAEAQIERVRTADALRAEWLRLAAGRAAQDGFAQLAPARLAREQGLGVSWERIVVERRVIGSALQKIVGEQPPQDPAKWREWWDKVKAQRASSGPASTPTSNPGNS